jgi:lipopolysaccharide/colanic/teichoic acid biosynthesis glycosyltransferase
MSIASNELEAVAYEEAIGWGAADDTRRIQAACKRAVDIIGSLILIAVFAVPMVLIAMAIRLESRGDALIRQHRLGIYGEGFRMLKFRSMRDRAEQMRDELSHQNEADGPLFKIKEDPRRTGMGKFIRRTSIDELPNLFNVLRGEMSLVGPRPPLPHEVDQYTSRHMRRLAVKPGMTGLWQIRGRSLLSFEEMIDLDLEYVESWSVLKDLGIMLRTVPAVLTARGAY